MINQRRTRTVVNLASQERNKSWSPGGILVTILSFLAVCVACTSVGSSDEAPGTDAPVTEVPASDTPATEPAATESSNETGATSTMANEPDDAENAITGETFLLAERSVFGAVEQRLERSADELATGGEIELMVGPQREDGVDRTTLVSRLPLDQIVAMDGSYILLISPSGQETVTVRSTTWIKTESGAALEVELQGSGVDGIWSYSLDPRFRSVLITDDDPRQGFEGSIYHVADFGPGPVSPVTEILEDGWILSTFETPLWFTDQTPLAEACERIVMALNQQLGQEDLRWGRADVDVAALDRAATTVEKEWLPDGQQINLTVDVAGQEVIRGKRLQPFVRYPVTLREDGGGLVSATLGCSVSAI